MPYAFETIFSGEMPERLNGAVSKTVVHLDGPGVRIPLSPPRFGEVSERPKEHAWKACRWAKPASRVRIPPSPPVTIVDKSFGVWKPCIILTIIF